MSLLTELDKRRDEAGPAYRAEIAATTSHLVAAGVPQSAQQVGNPAPDFALQKADGTALALSALLTSGPVVLSFLRGEWCPFCRTEIAALIEAAPGLAAAGASLVLLMPDPPSPALAASVAALPRAHVVQDPLLGVAMLYGLVFSVPARLRRFYIGRGMVLDALSDARPWLLPIPADFIVAPDRTIALSFIEADFSQRLDPALLIEAAEELGVGKRGRRAGAHET